MTILPGARAKSPMSYVVTAASSLRRVRTSILRRNGRISAEASYVASQWLRFGDAYVGAVGDDFCENLY